MATTKPPDDMIRFTDFFPVGWTVLWPGTTVPTIPGQTWLIPDGEAVSRTTYATLFALLGTSFGVGDGSTTFNLPTRSKFLRFNVAAIGAMAGADTHTLTVSEMPSHKHDYGQRTRGDFAFDTQTVVAPYGTGGTINTAYEGGGTAHNNMPAYQNWAVLMRVL